MTLVHSTLTLPPVEDAMHTIQTSGGALIPDHFCPAWEVTEAHGRHLLFSDYQGRLYVLRNLAWLEAADLAMRSANRRANQMA